jgi:hypothetical protein
MIRFLRHPDTELYCAVAVVFLLSFAATRIS